MRTLIHLFLSLALVGMLTGYGGMGLLALLWAGLCWYAGVQLDKVEPVVDTECDHVHAVSLVMTAQTEGSL